MSDVETSTEAREPDAFEKALTQAMRPVDAPEGFAERAMGRAAETAAGTIARVPKSGRGAPSSGARVVVMRSRFASLSQHAWVGGAIAAMLVLGVFGGEQLHAWHEREQAALATQQFEAGIRVTDQALAQTLTQTRAQLEHAGLRLGD